MMPWTRGEAAANRGPRGESREESGRKPVTNPGESPGVTSDVADPPYTRHRAQDTQLPTTCRGNACHITTPELRAIRNPRFSHHSITHSRIEGRHHRGFTARRMPLRRESPHA
jgi:hypothetical protein